MTIPSWKLDDLTVLTDLTGREALDALITRLGGDALARSLAEQRAARLALQADLPADGRERFITYADASTDLAATREHAATRAGLCYGVALGAALARFPHERPAAVLEAATLTAASVLSGELPPASARQVAEAVLAALAPFAESASAT